MFAEVHVYSVPGNHGRVQPKKEDNLRGENFDCLVPFIVGLLLKDYENVEIHENVIEQTVAMFSVRGQKVFGVHGDKDAMESVVQKLTMMFSMKPDIVLAGHRHTNGMRTIYDSRVIESGCMSGPDSYCMDHRLKNKPEQTVVVVTDNGVECTYNVVF
jgi:predicted phosphodiesterase